MPLHSRSQQEDDLREMLKREASSSRPLFSELRHQRLRKAVHSAGAAIVTKDSVRRRWRSSTRWWTGLAVALSVLLLLGIAWRLKQRSPSESAPRDSVPQIVLDSPREGVSPPSEQQQAVVLLPFGEEILPLLAVADTSATSAAWAYLDHDAKVMLDWAVQRLPRAQPTSTRDAVPGT
jgi:hypothetical protein